MNMNIYCGLQFYNKASIEKLLNDSKVQGIVLGDLFCQKRMFDGGIPEMFEMLSLVGCSGKKLIFQTPMYNCEKQFEETIQILTYLDRFFSDSYVSTTDIGIALWCWRKCENLHVIWNRYGRNREKFHNVYFFEFLEELHVIGLETDYMDDAKCAAEHNIEPWVIYESDSYRSLGRICYNRYQLDIRDKECGRYCSNSNYEMRTKDGRMSMSLDGYILDQKWKKNPAFYQILKQIKVGNVICYARNIEEFEAHIKEIDL